MDHAALAADADGETVTVERLTDAVVDALAAGEQPHHLAQGVSLDVAGPEATAEEGDRAFAAMDAVATAVATDRRLLFVVPRPVGVRTEAVPYDAVRTVRVSTTTPTSIRVTGVDGGYRFNVRGGESPGALAAYVEDRAADAAPPTRGGTEGGDAGVGESSAASATPADPDDDPFPDPTTDGAAVDADGGRSTGEASGTDADDPLASLERLAALHERGVLSDEEFARAKRDVLDDL